MRLSHLGFVPVALATVVGCSDPVPPTPRGAFTVSFADPGIDCSIGPHNAQVGSVLMDRKDKVVVDGTEDARIDCTVTPAGSGFKVSASARQKDKGLFLEVPSISPGATEETPATGGLSYSSATTADAFNNSDDEPCQFYFIPGTGEGVSAGKVWLAFKCPTVVSDGNECAIAQSFAIFENCSE